MPTLNPDPDMKVQANAKAAEIRHDKVLDSMWNLTAGKIYDKLKGHDPQAAIALAEAMNDGAWALMDEEDL